MTTLNSRLQLALLNRKRCRNLLEKGFTLVELMIVIVIVGILSAVALPNFLKQQEKAKATEAKIGLNGILKAAYSDFQYEYCGDDAIAAAEEAIDTATSDKFTYDDGASTKAYYLVAGEQTDPDKTSFAGGTVPTGGTLSCNPTNATITVVANGVNDMAEKSVWGCVNLLNGKIQVTKVMEEYTAPFSFTTEAAKAECPA